MTIFDKGNLATEKLRKWIKYTDSINRWQDIVKGIDPKVTGCGLIFELNNPPEVNIPDDDFAIADMRTLHLKPGYSEPHYHPGLTDKYPKGVTEIYIVLSGSAKSIVGYEEFNISVGDVVVIPPFTAHYIIPDKEFVIAVISSPPFKPETYIPVVETNEEVKFDTINFSKLTRNNLNK